MASKRKTRTVKKGNGSRRKVASAAAVQFDVPTLPALALAGRLDRVAKIVSRAAGEVARKHDATPSQLHVVERLARASNGLTAKQLAAALAIRPGSLTGTLDGLQRKGVLQRQAVEGDARQQRLVLLEGARELVELLPAVDVAVAASLSGLNDKDIATLNSAMSQAEKTVRAKSAIPTPASLAPAPPPEAQPAPAPAPAPAPEHKPEPKPDPTPPPQSHKPAWEKTEPPPQSEGSLSRGLFRIASRVLGAADRRRKK